MHKFESTDERSDSQKGREASESSFRTEAYESLKSRDFVSQQSGRGQSQVPADFGDLEIVDGGQSSQGQEQRGRESTSKQQRPGDTQPAETESEPQDSQEPQYDDFPYSDMLYLDVQPQIHTVAPGETVDSVARAHLGPGRQEWEYQEHAEEIRRLNAGNETGPGGQVVLPGHTQNGDIVLLNKDGTTYVVSGDPAVRAAEEAEFTRRYGKPPAYATQTQQPADQPQGTGCYPVVLDYDHGVRFPDGTPGMAHVRYRAERCPTPPGSRTPYTDRQLPGSGTTYTRLPQRRRH